MRLIKIHQPWLEINGHPETGSSLHTGIHAMGDRLTLLGCHAMALLGAERDSATSAVHVK